MKLKNWSIATFLLGSFLLGCQPAAAANPLRQTLPISTGTFTQPSSVDKYTSQEQWDQEFQAMKAAGMDLWIYQWTADSKNKTTIYPTHFPGYSQISSYDQVEWAMQTAQKFGFKVFLGLAFNEDWWDKEGSDVQWLQNEAAQMNQVADELYAHYYALYPQTFAGWYINWEMDNFAGYNTLFWQKNAMVDALNLVTHHLHQLNPALKTSIAPFFNTSGGAGPAAWGNFWKDVMSHSEVDILMLQDGVGVGHAKVADLPRWFDAVCGGVTAAGKQCWADLENFVGEDSTNSPAPIKRLVSQHQILAPRVDRIVTFSFITAMSPVFGNDPAVYQNYLNYVKSVENQ